MCLYMCTFASIYLNSAASLSIYCAENMQEASCHGSANFLYATKRRSQTSIVTISANMLIIQCINLYSQLEYCLQDIQCTGGQVASYWMQYTEAIPYTSSANCQFNIVHTCMYTMYTVTYSYEHTYSFTLCGMMSWSSGTCWDSSCR